MVTDLVYQDMGHDLSQRVLVLGPIIEDRPAIKPDHVGHNLGGCIRLKRQSDTLEQAEQVELALGSHTLEDLFSREILNADDEVLTEIAEVPRETGVSLGSQALNIGQGRRSRSAPIAELARHGTVVGEVFTRS